MDVLLCMYMYMYSNMSITIGFLQDLKLARVTIRVSYRIKVGKGGSDSYMYFKGCTCKVVQSGGVASSTSSYTCITGSPTH